MNLATVEVAPKPAKKVRRYAVAYTCTTCGAHGWLDDFHGEQETRCSCGQSICVAVDTLPEFPQ